MAVASDGLTLPRFQSWSVTWQHQLNENMILDVSYIGNHGTRLNHHFQTLGVDANMNDPMCPARRQRMLTSTWRGAGGRIKSPYPGSAT